VIEDDSGDNEDSQLDLHCGWWFVWLQKSAGFWMFLLL